MAKRIPNRIKFSFVNSTSAKIEGTLVCSDAGFDKIMAILMEEIDASKRERDASQTTEGGSLDADIRAAAVKAPLSDKDPTNIQY